jgi:hypothetical protein
MIFVTKSSPERTRVPRRVTNRLTVRCLVNINPCQSRISSTVAPRKPQHHHLRSLRSESKKFFFLKQAHGVKRAIKEAGEGGGAATPARRARGGVTTPSEIIPYYRLNHSIWSLSDNKELSRWVLPGLRSVNHLKTQRGSNVCLKTPTKESPECLTN